MFILDVLIAQAPSIRPRNGNGNPPIVNDGGIPVGPPMDDVNIQQIQNDVEKMVKEMPKTLTPPGDGTQPQQVDPRIQRGGIVTRDLTSPDNMVEAGGYMAARQYANYAIGRYGLNEVSRDSGWLLRNSTRFGRGVPTGPVGSRLFARGVATRAAATAAATGGAGAAGAGAASVLGPLAIVGVSAYVGYSAYDDCSQDWAGCDRKVCEKNVYDRRRAAGLSTDVSDPNVVSEIDREIDSLRGDRQVAAGINTGCTAAGALYGLATLGPSFAASGAAIGQCLIPIPVVGALIGAVVGLACAAALGAGLGNLVGNIGKSIWNFFSGRSSRY